MGAGKVWFGGSSDVMLAVAVASITRDRQITLVKVVDRPCEFEARPKR